jgi:serine/threonine-protein kinase
LSDPVPLSRFGAYEVLFELKSGGMGSVLLGRRRGPGAFEQLVAIKTIRPEHAGSQVVRAMFLDEAAILARLPHPGIAHVHDFGEEAGTLYMVMEYVAGIPFRELGELQPPPIVVARAVAEACRGLHAAHEARDLAGHPLGLVHRDISPDNLMLGFDGHVKVIDFGIALVKNRQAPVTEFGSLKGKPPYMSPEQIKNQALDRRSDVFSLGVVLWELLAGTPLFEGDSIYAIAIAVQEQPIELPSRVRGEALPLGLDAAVLNALDRDLTRRTPSAAALAEALEEVVQAAGGETLEAWAERALWGRRDQHREWLASVVAGTQRLPRAVGRPSGQVTELQSPPGGRPLAAVPALVAPATGMPHAPEPQTSVGGDSASIALPRRKRAPLALALLLLLLVAGGGIALYLGTRAPVAVAVVRDAAAALDAGHTVELPADARVVIVEVPVDAPSATRDAGRLRAVVVRPLRDAALATPPVAADAGTAPALAGTAFFTAKHGDHYLNVIADGHMIGVTPILKAHQLAAGRHVLELVEPASGEVVVHREVTLHDGEHIELAP